MRIEVYTDGSSDNNRKMGGYGYVITGVFKGENVLKKFKSGKYVDTTNNRMELKSIIKALESIKPGHSIEVYSDSQYCVRSINEWLSGWVASGKLKEKQNPDLWLRFLEVKEKHRSGGSDLKFIWLRGHNGHGLNEMADKLANHWRSLEGGVSCKMNN